MDAASRSPNIVDFAAFRERALLARRRANRPGYLLWYPGVGAVLQGSRAARPSGHPAGVSRSRV